MTEKAEKSRSEKLSEIKLSPLLPLSRTIPIEVTQENREAILENRERHEKEQVRNTTVFEQSSIPWVDVILFLFLVALIVSLKFVPKAFWDVTQQKKQKQQERKTVIESLQALAKKQKISPEKDFYQLSHIMRQFMENQENIPTQSQTTPELLQRVQTSSKYDPETKKKLQKLFEETDLVLFARLTPSKEEFTELTDSMLHIVENKLTS